MSAPRNVRQTMLVCSEHEDCTVLHTTFVNEHGRQERVDHLAGPKPERLLNDSYPEALHLTRGVVRRPRNPALDELGLPAAPRRRWWRRLRPTP